MLLIHGSFDSVHYWQQIFVNVLSEEAVTLHVIHNEFTKMLVLQLKINTENLHNN